MIKNETQFIEDGLVFHGSIPHVMGTRFEMLATGAPKEPVSQIWNWLCVESKRLEMLLDRFNPESEISRVNHSGSLDSASPLLRMLVDLALSYRDKTQGLFDIYKGGMDLDFGGFAKGYMLKELKDVLALAGVENAFIDFGGSSIMAIGHHPFGDSWKVEVRNPFDTSIILEVELKNQSMSVSGNTPVYSGHIVNPFTREPVNDRMVVTATGDDPLDVEVLSTAAILSEEGMLASLAKSFPNAKVERFIF